MEEGLEAPDAPAGRHLQTQAAHCYTAAFSVVTSCHVSLYRHICRGVCTRL